MQNTQRLSQNSDYYLSEKSCDNRENHIQKEAIIIFREKLKRPFRINPTMKIGGMLPFSSRNFAIIRSFVVTVQYNKLIIY